MSFDLKSAAIGGAVTLGLAGLVNQFLKYKNQPSALPSTVELKEKMKNECTEFLDEVKSNLRNMNGASQWYSKLANHVRDILVLVNNLPDLEGLDANGVMRLNELEREALLTPSLCPDIANTPTFASTLSAVYPVGFPCTSVSRFPLSVCCVRRGFEFSIVPIFIYSLKYPS